MFRISALILFLGYAISESANVFASGWIDQFQQEDLNNISYLEKGWKGTDNVQELQSIIVELVRRNLGKDANISKLESEIKSLKERNCDCNCGIGVVDPEPVENNCIPSSPEINASMEEIKSLEDKIKSLEGHSQNQTARIEQLEIENEFGKESLSKCQEILWKYDAAAMPTPVPEIIKLQNNITTIGTTTTTTEEPTTEATTTTTTTTTTTEGTTSTTTTSKPPIYSPGCRLPFNAEIPIRDSISLADGIRFGNFDKLSRLEFEEKDDDNENDDGHEPTSELEYSIDFKASSPDGVLLMKTNIATQHFLALYIFGGSVHFAFNSGAGICIIRTSLLYDDNNWHSVTVKRYMRKGVLIIDGFLVERRDCQGTSVISAGSTLYVGGLSKPVWDRVFNTGQKIKYIDNPFIGCLRNLQIRGKDPGQPSLIHSAEPCTENEEKGTFFFEGKGFLRPADNFAVGRRIIISLSIRPRSLSGILLSAQGPKDYMVLQLVNGTLKFSVHSGKGVLTSSFNKIQNQVDLCDGQWHKIRVSKSKNVVALSVDNVYALPGIGAAETEATDTNGPLYVGGIPAKSTKFGLETEEQFVGCMKDLHIETEPPNFPMRFTYDSLEGAVALFTCPTN